MTIDFDANMHLSGDQTDYDALVLECLNLNGDFVVCETSEGFELLARYNASVRKDVKIVYCNQAGYSFGA